MQRSWSLWLFTSLRQVPFHWPAMLFVAWGDCSVARQARSKLEQPTIQNVRSTQSVGIRQSVRWGVKINASGDHIFIAFRLGETKHAGKPARRAVDEGTGDGGTCALEVSLDPEFSKFHANFSVRGYLSFVFG